MSLGHLLPPSTPSFNLHARTPQNTNPQTTPTDCITICRFTPPNTNTSITLTEQITRQIDDYGWNPQYVCPMFNETTNEVYPVKDRDYLHANEPSCTRDYCNFVTGPLFTDAMEECFNQVCPNGGKDVDLELVESWGSISNDVMKHCNAAGHVLPPGVGVRQSIPTDDVGLGPDDEAIKPTKFRGKCTPEFCAYTPPFTQSNVRLGTSFSEDLAIQGWRVEPECEKHWILSSNNETLQDTHPDCMKDACMAVHSERFVSAMEKCYRRACEDDEDFEYNWKLLKGMTRREPFRTKVNEEDRETCGKEGVVLMEWTEDGKDGKDGKEDGTDENESLASVSGPWKGGVMVCALLAGSFFAGLM
ncbi:hypothetical protein BJ508DRAFT_305958 [Ascobolus immersus RN42]|uniref:Uncharacterized protein n=1 Tax=Ascobolus immersus RN42 TaxID=1160509 RepID=A0A3N4I9D2_ASCIM|nr:hypothetical protein BJ508DRAFT_305958 [Ascobolus immersus RN42]